MGDPGEGVCPARRITKEDVNTFLAESGRPEFSFRLLIATTNLIGRTAKRTIAGQEKQASVLLLGDLEAAEIDWPASPSDLRSRRLPPKGPWPYQRQAINEVVKGFERADRGQVTLAVVQRPLPPARHPRRRREQRRQHDTDDSRDRPSGAATLHDSRLNGRLNGRQGS